MKAGQNRKDTAMVFPLTDEHGHWDLQPIPLTQREAGLGEASTGSLRLITTLAGHVRVVAVGVKRIMDDGRLWWLVWRGQVSVVSGECNN